MLRKRQAKFTMVRVGVGDFFERMSLEGSKSEG